jgi:hypothetical protein
MTTGAGEDRPAEPQDAGPLERSGPVGLGGWLVIPLLGLFLAPVVAASQAEDFLGIADAWPFLSIPQAAFIGAELAVNAFLSVIVPIVLLVFAFKRLEIFPLVYVVWAAARPVIVIVDAVLGYWMFQETFEADGEAMFDKETLKSLSQSIWAAVIWIPYMIVSKRVENTFVK